MIKMCAKVNSLVNVRINLHLTLSFSFSFLPISLFFILGSISFLFSSWFLFPSFLHFISSLHFTSYHLFNSSLLHFFTSSLLHYFTSSSLHLFTSSPLRFFASSPLHLFITSFFCTLRSSLPSIMDSNMRKASIKYALASLWRMLAISFSLKVFVSSNRMALFSGLLIFFQFFI
jgi:hypothetical protein